jgi:hypothetical protein
MGEIKILNPKALTVCADHDDAYLCDSGKWDDVMYPCTDITE